ncbi:MAG TPA: hypothetical protein VN737_06235 [Bryobacteraceae bacterium]|nr:hypothetical protein [Bryobacteraceae bacterium]
MTKRRILGSMLPNMAALALSIGLISQPGFGQQLPWMDTGLTAQVRTELLLRAMTLDDKIEQIAVLPSPNTDIAGLRIHSPRTPY